MKEGDRVWIEGTIVEACSDGVPLVEVWGMKGHFWETQLIPCEGRVFKVIVDARELEALRTIARHGWKDDPDWAEIAEHYREEAGREDLVWPTPAERMADAYEQLAALEKESER